MRKIIFISHATPTDNGITEWLSLQLMGLGYEVWSDVINLKGGEKWWEEIESVLRKNTIKFILILSNASNNAEGVLNELSVAKKVASSIQDDNFIIPLHIDPDLSYADYNIEFNRLNSIKFTDSWALGFERLLERLTSSNVPKSKLSQDIVANKWSELLGKNRTIIETNEEYSSSWFPIVELPEYLYFHNFGNLFNINNIKKLKYPAREFKGKVATFAAHDHFVDQYPKTKSYNPERTRSIKVEDILNGVETFKFISLIDSKRILVSLLNKSFYKLHTYIPELSTYKMSSNRISYYLERDAINKDKIGNVKLVGKMKDKNWHYGISAIIKLQPIPLLSIRSHLWFTSDGHKLLDSTKQHVYRRSKGKNWWNKQWKNRINAMMTFLAEKKDSLIYLELGDEVYAKVDKKSIIFNSPVSYKVQDDENLIIDSIAEEGKE